MGINFINCGEMRFMPPIPWPHRKWNFSRAFANKKTHTAGHREAFRIFHDNLWLSLFVKNELFRFQLHELRICFRGCPNAPRNIGNGYCMHFGTLVPIARLKNVRRNVGAEC